MQETSIGQLAIVMQVYLCVLLCCWGKSLHLVTWGSSWYDINLGGRFNKVTLGAVPWALERDPQEYWFGAAWCDWRRCGSPVLNSRLWDFIPIWNINVGWQMPKQQIQSFSLWTIASPAFWWCRLPFWHSLVKPRRKRTNLSVCAQSYSSSSPDVWN